MHLRKPYVFGVLAIAALVAALLPAPAAAAGPPVVVASGLDSPRGIAFMNGGLFVAEAGHGGPTCMGGVCVGGTGQVSRVNVQNHSVAAVVTGLFSLSLGVEGTIGPSGLTVSEGNLLLQVGASQQEAGVVPIGQAQAGRLMKIRGNGTWSTVANVGEFDYNYTLRFPEPGSNPAAFYPPPAQEHDANPYGVLGTDDGVYVADAGANTLTRVDEDGQMKVLIHDPFRPNPPTFPSDAVPTCVVKTEGGFLVGELSGRLLKVHGHSFTVLNVANLSHITGCTTDRHGNVYFVNMFGPGPVFTPPPASKFFIGNVVKYNPESRQSSILVDGLRFPNMATVGPDGNLYVTVGSICGPTPGPAGSPCAGLTGSVIRINLPHGGENDD